MEFFALLIGDTDIAETECETFVLNPTDTDIM
jgi:hypothetical protein